MKLSNEQNQVVQPLVECGWKEAAIAWSVARSLMERRYHVTEQGQQVVQDYRRAEEKARALALEQIARDEMPLFTFVPTGGTIDLRHPDPKAIRIEDIALVLSRRYRFNGSGNISVAAHSLIGEERAAMLGLSARQRLQILLHDSPETYLSDFIRPLKRQFPLYAALETLWEQAIFAKYDLGEPMYTEIDNWLLSTEIYHQFAHRFPGKQWTREPINDAWANERYDFYADLEPNEVQRKFEHRFYGLVRSESEEEPVDGS